MSTNSGTVSGAFSERIKQLRKAKGASQAQVAEYLGVTKQAYSLYETGKREPPFATLLLRPHRYERRYRKGIRPPP